MLWSFTGSLGCVNEWVECRIGTETMSSAGGDSDVITGKERLEHEVIVQETLLRAPDSQMFESAD